jgi:hypothetical protein
MIFNHWVDASYGGSISIEITLLINPYKILKMIQTNMVVILKKIIILIFE